jgi:thermitase
MRLSIILGSLLAALAFPAAASADESIIVKRVPGLDASERSAVREDAGVRLDETTTLANTEVVTAAPGELDEALDALNDNPDVVYAEPNVLVAPATNDNYFSFEWGLHNIG